MPSLKAYTPYETLAFCQSIAHHGVEPAAFEDIASSLNANELIRESQTYDQSRLTAVALQGLYNDLILVERHLDAPIVNGDNGANTSNPKKRKLSTSPAPTEQEGPSEEQLLQTLVEKLYAQFREQAIKEIREDETAYAGVQSEIEELEKRVREEERQQQQARALVDKAQADYDQQKRLEREASKAALAQTSPDPAAAQLQANLDASRPDQSTPKPPALNSVEPKGSPVPTRNGQQQQPILPLPSPAPSTPTVVSAKSSAEPVSNRASQAPPPPPSSGPAQHHSPGSFNRTLPVPSPQRPNYGPINQQHFQPGPQGHPVPILPPIPGMPHMPPPTEFPSQKRSTPTPSPGQGRGSPLPIPPQQSFPGYPGYPPSPWPPHMSPQHHQYQQPLPYANAPYYAPSPNGRPTISYQTPHHPQYQPYPQSAPIHYQGQPPPQGWQPPLGQPYYPYPNSTNVTPVPRSDSRRSLLRPRSSTPWKKRMEQSQNIRPPSPVRPEREVSPLSETESPSRPPKASRRSPPKKEQKSDDNARVVSDNSKVRGRQAASATPSAFAGSRSQSIASMNSETPTEKRRKGRQSQKIKAEPPSTPAPMMSDSEQQQKSSGRRGRPRTTTVSSGLEPPPTAKTNKRKRSSARDSVTPPLPLPRAERSPGQQSSHDPTFVAVSKSFTKTALLLLNDINSHKLASIFAKPLSEREAPGYKELILRPQDLKSIKAAITKGGRAAHAAIEVFEEEDRSGEETPTKNAPSLIAESREGPLGNGMYLFKTSEDLMPPKGIVTSSQLEMELVRLFANAIMFNPLSSSERGFGRSLRLRKNGGDVVPLNQESPEPDNASSSEESDGAPSSDGGIISDTREMFEDILARIRKWRELEVERIGTEDPSNAKGVQASFATLGSASASVRHSSVSSALNDDEGAVEAVSTPVAASSTTGTARKRRRIADN